MLNDDEKENLHLALLAYLEVQGFNRTKNALRAKAGVTKKTQREHRKIIPENWRAIVKLRRQITQLEEKNRQLKEDIKNFGSEKKDSDPMPKKPAAHTFTKHTNVITCVRFHPKYPSVASSSEDASIMIYNADSGVLEQELRGHQDAVNCIAWNPKGTQLASVSADMTIKFWDPDDGKCTKTLTGHEHNVSYVTYSNNGKFLLTASRDKSIKKWDVATGALKHTYTGHSEWVRVIALHPANKTFATAGQDQTIKFWTLKTQDSKTETNTFTEAHTDQIECLAFSTDEADEYIIKDLLKGDVQKAHKDALKADKASGDVKLGGRFLLSGSRDKSIKMWSIQTGKVVWSVDKAHDNWVRGLVFHPSGKYFLSCSDDKSIRVWSTQAGTEPRVKIRSAHGLFVTSIDWCSSMDICATGGVDSKVKIWACA